MHPSTTTEMVATRRAAGVLLVLVPLGFVICFSLLQQLFEYPSILRQSPAEVLAKFVAGGWQLIAVWYLLTLTAVAFVPLTILVHRVLAERGAPVVLWVATAFGLLAGIAQTLGFLRWPFLVPYLAQTYLAPGASDAQRVSAEIVFQAFHRYAGVAVGEHMGYLATSLWTLLISVVMLRGGVLPRWLGVCGIVLALGIAVGLTEPTGFAPGATVNALSYLAWAVWLIAFGIILLARPVTAPVARIPAEATVS
jgi:hypothetical protein